MKEKIFLIDGSALAYRSYFAFLRSPLINSKGENVSAVYGFLNALRSLIEQESPQYLLIAFDTGSPTFRHEQYPAYKATREKMPTELSGQLPRIDQLLDAFNICVIKKDGVEADDVIGTLAVKAAAEGHDVFIVTGDKDFMQLVNDKIKIYDIRTISGETDIIDREKVKEKFGVYPENVTDVLALTGDSSDNVPGVPQIGPKTALKLLENKKSLEELLASIDTVQPERIRQKLADNINYALISKQLVTIKTDVGLPVSIDDMALKEPDTQKLASFYRDMEFTKFLNELTVSIPKEHPVMYTLVDTAELFTVFFSRLSKSTFFVFDTETDSVNPLTAKLVGMSFAFEEYEAFYIPSSVSSAPEQRDLFSIEETSLFETVLHSIKPILENPEIKKCGHNIKYDSMVLKKYGISLNGVYFDTMIASYLLRPTIRHHNLDAVSLFYLNFKKTPTSDLIGSGKNQITMDKVDIQKVSSYACEDADITLRLHNTLRPMLENAGLLTLFESVEIPLIEVLTAMELEGISVDVPFLKAMSDELQKNIIKTEQEIYTLAGEEFNIKSPQQICAVLFDKLAIHKQLNIKLRKTKTGYKTDVEVLESLAEHPLPRLIIEYRQLTKLKSTYVDTLPELLNPITHRLHTSFNQTITATGRLSSSDPNLQNIPVRTELGKRIRQAFVASAPDKKLVAADYSQIELRLLAHLSQDKTLLDSFRHHHDIHTMTASLIFDVPIGLVSPELRYKAKAINFGIIYGMGQAKLARETGISQKEAKEFIQAYFEKYPGVKQYIDDTLEKARKDGYVNTMLNRKREIPEIHSESSMIRSNAENIAVNTPLQGTCADLIKLAMIDIYKKFRLGRYNSKMLLQIHDELLFEVPDCEINSVIPIIKSSMENAIKLDVPIEVKIHAGTNWMEV
ncbi:DNA polymerase I [bacterium]|nr:DNA polymerase I [bacterium]